MFRRIKSTGRKDLARNWENKMKFNKKGFFFFFFAEKRTKQEQIFGVKLKTKCSCGNDKYNITFNFARLYIFFFIPIGGWKLERVWIQCIKCGRIGLAEKQAKAKLLEMLKKTNVTVQ